MHRRIGAIAHRTQPRSAAAEAVSNHRCPRSPVSAQAGHLFEGGQLVTDLTSWARLLSAQFVELNCSDCRRKRSRLTNR